MRGEAQYDGGPLARSKLLSYFSQFVDQSTLGYVRVWVRHCSLQHCFQFDDNLLHWEDIPDKVAIAKLQNQNLR